MGLRSCHLPFDTRTSLRPVGAFWRNEAADDSSPHRDTARRLVRLMDADPAIEASNLTPAGMEALGDRLDELFAGFLPAGARDESVLMAIRPFSQDAVYLSPAARRLNLSKALTETSFINLTDEMWEIGSTVKGYNLVLSRIYGVETDFDYPVVATIPDESTGLVRHFRLHWDARFVDVKLRGERRDLSPEDLARIIAEPMNIPLWMELLPPDAFDLEGVVLLTAEDATADHALSLLKNDLLVKGAMSSPERLDHLQHRIRTLMRRKDLQLGLLAVERGQDLDRITGARPLGRSLLMSDGAMPDCPLKSQSFYAQAYETREPVLVHDLDQCGVCSGFERKLLKQGIRNLLIWPLYVGGELVGMVELGSSEPGAVNAFNSLQLAEVQGLIATAIEREGKDREDRVQAVIKQQYTAIHPSVEWRFREAARAFIAADERGESPTPEPVVFPGVYPFYGLSDIRGSSEIRARAIQADLRDQLDLAERVLKLAFEANGAPLLDQLAFRLGEYRNRVETGLRSEDESSLLEFLKEDVEPLLTRLSAMNPAVETAVTAYRDAIDPDLGVLYNQRRAFENSVTRLNQTVMATLEMEQEAAQAVQPHFFEQFVTDGVEYTAYMGESLSETGDFHPLHLQNLRLWQLMLMFRVEWALREDRSNLEIPLEATHLILVQDQPLAIRFRAEEKQFDVDGAYNIRYEIAKKRIDKARIKGSRERLTQPGTIAVVYANPKEAREYVRYLEYLAARGYSTGPIEEMELEDMQGVRGLKALRVQVAERPPEARELTSTEALPEIASVS